MSKIENPNVYPIEGGPFRQGGDGETLLDRFAGLAMQGMIVAGHTDDLQIAEKAHQYAKAMLIERSKTLKSMEDEG